MSKLIGGTVFSYYFVCHRKLWLYCNGISLEETNEDVQMGKLIDKSTNKREKKNLIFDGVISVDFIKGRNILHEVKKSRSIEEASEWQLKYYLYYLQKKGIEVKDGILDYPLLKIRKQIELKEEDIIKIENVLEEIKKIISQEKVPKVSESKICSKCAYYEYCYI
jgi:CRISPR-associated exonuclease Cas4